jgi:tetratricopeptide (TPR) repeat protein
MSEMQHPQRETARHSARRAVWISVLLGAFTLFLYWPVRHYEFVNYDDPVYVVENRMIQQGWTIESLNWAFTKTYSSNWHPLTWLSHALDWSLYGRRAGGHHVTSMLFHAANTLLMFWVWRLLTGTLWRSALVAALFAWHPLHVESVAWVSERKDVLSTFFGLLALWGYGRHALKTGIRYQSLEHPRSMFGFLTSNFYWLTLLFFALGLMSKPMLVTLPFVLLLLDYWPLQRFSLGPYRNFQDLRVIILEKIPFLILSAASSVMTFWAQQQGGAMVPLERMSLGVRIGNALVSYPRYLGKIFWPRNMVAFYPHPGALPVLLVLGAALFLIVASGVVVWQRRRRPYLAVGWFWFFGTLVPVIGVVQVGAQAMADRYTYLPSIGIFVMAIWGGAELLSRWPIWRAGLAALIVVACATVAAQQMRAWQNTETLLRHALAVTKNNGIAHNNLGGELAAQGRNAEAKEQFLAAIRLRKDANPYLNLGNLLLKEGKADEALVYLSEALRLNPGSAKAHASFACVLADKGRIKESLQHFEKALNLNPHLIEPHYNLARTLEKDNKPAEALSHYEAAWKLGMDVAFLHYKIAILSRQQGRPVNEYLPHLERSVQLDQNYPDAHFELGEIWWQQGRKADAEQQFQAGLRLKPDHVVAHRHLAGLALARGQLEEAIAHWRAALRSQPDIPEVCNNLAWILATYPDEKIRNGKEAVELAERACRLDENKNPSYWDTLAAVYAEVGRFDEAVSVIQRTIAATKSSGQTNALPPLEHRLELYQSGKPYREP